MAVAGWRCRFRVALESIQERFLPRFPAGNDAFGQQKLRSVKRVFGNVAIGSTVSGMTPIRSGTSITSTIIPSNMVLPRRCAIGLTAASTAMWNKTSRRRTGTAMRWICPVDSASSRVARRFAPQPTLGLLQGAALYFLQKAPVWSISTSSARIECSRRKSVTALRAP